MKVNIYGDNIPEEDEKILLEKLLWIKSLNKIIIKMSQLDDKKISEIEWENYSVKELNIDWLNKEECILYNLQNKFTILTNLTIFSYKFVNCKTTLEIKENINSKDINFSLGGFGNIKFYCHSYEHLENIEIKIQKEIINIKESLPIFNEKCNIIFKSLTSFYIGNHNFILDLNVIEKIYFYCQKLKIIRRINKHFIFLFMKIKWNTIYKFW